MPHASLADVPALVAACRVVLASSAPIEVAEEYGYASLPLCVIDSVFSIGVRYEGVRNVIKRYCRRFGMPKQAPKRTVPPREQQKSITGLLVRAAPNRRRPARDRGLRHPAARLRPLLTCRGIARARDRHRAERR